MHLLRASNYIHRWPTDGQQKKVLQWQKNFSMSQFLKKKVSTWKYFTFNGYLIQKTPHYKKFEFEKKLNIKSAKYNKTNEWMVKTAVNFFPTIHQFNFHSNTEKFLKIRMQIVRCTPAITAVTWPKTLHMLCTNYTL